MLNIFAKKKRRRTAFSGVHDVESRWKLVAPYLPSSASWMLDIGSNDGDTCRRAALLGHYVLGVEVQKNEVEQACRFVDKNVAYMFANVTPSYISSLPKFDVIFLLSVIHRMWAINGREYAEECIRECFNKADLLVIEGVVTYRRYTDKGQPPPDFQDSDVVSGVAWHEKWLTDLSSKDWAINFAGEVRPHNQSASRLIFICKRRVGVI